MDDWQLVREFVDKGAGGAFEALVGRYLDMVYGAALREVREHHLAEDVTQAVFAILATKARELKQGTVVAGWLFRTTRFAAANAMKMQRRRRFHEERAGRLREAMEADALREDRLRALDAALVKLSERDRGAVLLRYYRRLEIGEVAHVLGVSENAARRRVERAVSKMRSWMRSRDAELVGAIGVIGTKSASNMAAAALATAKGGAGSVETVSVLMKGAMKMMYMAKLKLAAIVAAGAMIVGSASVMTVHRLSAQTASSTQPQPIVQSGSPVDRTFAVFDAEVLNRRAEMDQYRQQHGITISPEGVVLELQFREKMMEELMDAEIQAKVTQDRLRKVQNSILQGTGAPPDAQTVQNAADAAMSRVAYLEKSLTDESRKVQDLDHFFVEYKRKEAELDALEKVRNELLVEKLRERAMMGG